MDETNGTGKSQATNRLTVERRQKYGVSSVNLAEALLFAPSRGRKGGSFAAKRDKFSSFNP